MTGPRRLADFDLTDLDNFADGFPHHIFAVHRAEAPVYWHEPTEHTPDGEGFWSVATHAEALDVMRDARSYSSETGGTRPYGGTILPDSPGAGSLLNMMDDPRHQRIRMLVTKGLTPRTITRLEADLRRRARALFAAIDERADGATTGECDYLLDIAAELPMQAICILLGIPEADRHALFAHVEKVFDFGNRRSATDYDASMAESGGAMMEYGTALIAEKRAQPRDDMLSIVVNASLPGEEQPALSDGELLSFFTLLFAAGSDTTRNAAAGGMLELARDPGQWQRVVERPAAVTTAIEEFVRWISPAAYNRRTATLDTTLAGQSIRAGDKVVFWEASANRDERVFADSMRFDAERDPNPHVGFGHGVHHCLGANLARLELRILIEETIASWEAIELAGPPEWARSNKHTGLRHLPIRYTRRSR
jgi:cytochrome P450